MKKLLFSAYSLDVGGIETALVTLLNELIKKDYDITLVLEKKEGIFLEDISKKINIIQYSPSAYKNIIIRKILNFLKRVNFILKYKNKYDFAASFATYSLSGSFTARVASKNNALWVHSNYMQMFNNNEDKFINFFNKIKINKFKNIIFVSNDAKNAFIKLFENLENKCQVINNLIDYKKIIKLSEEKITETKEDKTTFLYLGRLTEEDKKVSRIIESTKKLKEKGLEFKILIVGDGKDRNTYTNKAKEYKLDKEIVFLGKKKNPYPYFLISDYLLLTSEYEGYPVVYNEAKILGLPILTTNVSDCKEIIGDKYGIITKKDVNSIASQMENFIKNRFELKEKFDVAKYNKENIKLLENIFKG